MKKLYLVIICAVVISAGLVAFYFYSQNGYSVPKDIRNQLTFSPLVIPKDSELSAKDYKYASVEGSEKVLSYVVSLPEGSVTVSQYTQPSQFSDIPEYKDRFLSNIIKQTNVIQSANGTIYIGKQEKQNNQQLGVMIERGLLVFMSPSHDLSDSNWRLVGDSFEIEKR